MALALLRSLTGLPYGETDTMTVGERYHPAHTTQLKYSSNQRHPQDCWAEKEDISAMVESSRDLRMGTVEGPILVLSTHGENICHDEKFEPK